MTCSEIFNLADVSYKYAGGKGTRVFDRFSMKVDMSRCHALYGGNGCGKSTLLALLRGLEIPDSGTICGPNVSTLAMLFQDSSRSLFPWFTVRRNLELVNPATALNMDDAIVETAGPQLRNWLAGVFDKYPYELSGGQRQIVCFLRAILSGCRYLALDEPFAGVDDKNKAVLLSLLNRCREREIRWIGVFHEIDDCLLTADVVHVADGPPLRVKNSFSIHCEWPRSPSILHDHEAVSARKKILEVAWGDNK